MLKPLLRIAFIVLLALAPGRAAVADAYSDGLALFEKGDYFRAFATLKPLADEGNAAAQYKVGLMYHLGLGVKEDDAAALQWVKRSAEQAFADAQFLLGQMYTFGWGTRAEPDPDLQAVQWYFKAALQGHSEAQYNLGLMFLAGKGVEQSNEEGLKWIKRAADAGLPAAQSFVGTYSPKKKKKK